MSMLLSRNAVRHAIGVSFLLLILPALLPGTARGQSPVSTIAYGPSPSVAPDSRPLIQVSLSRPIYRIHIDAKTGAPQMPKDVTATAEVVNWPAGLERPQDFTWHVFLDWDFKPCPTHHSISDRTFTHSSPLKVDFGNEIRGGTLTVFAKTWLNGQEIWGKAHALVLGENPSRRTILRAFPPNRFGLLASKIGMVESDLCQFTAANGVDPGGMPVLSRTNDVGMMQLNAPTGSITSADQVW